MKGQRLESALAGARVFLDEMEELDRASVMLFSDRMLDATDFSERTADLDVAAVTWVPTTRARRRSRGLDQCALLARRVARLRRVPAVVALTCRARVSIARGESEKALRQMTAVLTHVHEDEAGADRLAWSFSVAGDAAASLDPLRAASLYRNSLAYAESTQVRAALVDVLLRAGQIDRARAALDSGSGALPLAVRRMIVARREGREAELAREIAETDSRFRQWIGDEDWLHAREMARFYLDVLPRPALARRLAEHNLTLQREPEDLLLARRVERCVSCND